MKRSIVQKLTAQFQCAPATVDGDSLTGREFRAGVQGNTSAIDADPLTAKKQLEFSS
jgi:hypothetical protein